MAKLFDHLGRPIDTGLLREEEAGPTITGVRQVISGHPAHLLTPTRLARLLLAAEEGDPTGYLELAEEMEEKDSHYRSVLSTRKEQVAGLEITVESATDAAEDIKAADLVRDWISREELREELFDILDAIGKGFSITEIIWDVSGKEWMPERLEWRDPRWFEFSREDGRTPLLRGIGGPRPLTPYKFISHIHKSKSGLPIRGGLARPVTWVYLFKRLDLQSWVQFAEIFGMPLRLGKYGQGTTEEQKRTLLRAVRSISQDAAAIIPASMQIEFPSVNVQGNAAHFEQFASWLDRQVSKCVLGQTGTTDVGQHVGTADAHERVRQDIEEADSRQLCASLNRHLVRPMVDLNQGPRKLYPRIVIGRPDEEDLDKMVDRLGKLVPMGLDVETSVVRDKLGFPDPPKGAVVLRAPGAPEAAPETPVKPEAGKAAHARRPQADQAEPQDAVDIAVAEELDGWEPLVRELTDPVERLSNECSTYEEFLARLPEAAAGQDPAALAEHLARLMFAARLAGEVGADLAVDRG